VAARVAVARLRLAVAQLRLAVAQLMAALAVAARVAAAEPVGAAAAVAVALAFGLEAAGAGPEETTPTAGNGIQPRANGSTSAINDKITPFATSDKRSFCLYLAYHVAVHESVAGPSRHLVRCSDMSDVG